MCERGEKKQSEWIGISEGLVQRQTDSFCELPVCAASEDELAGAGAGELSDSR